MEYNPREYQLIAVKHIFKHKRCALWKPMGMGKTSACIFALDTLRLVNSDKTLVLAPLRVAKSVWTDEAAKWDNLSHLKCVPIIGDAKERKERLQEPADIHTTNYENLPWLCSQVKDKWPWANVIADEATRLKSFRLGGKKGKRAKALAKLAFTKIDRFIELTGTPSPNGLKDLWGQLWFLDKGERLGRTYTAFIQRWFRQGRDGFSIEPLEFAFEQINERVKDICISFNVQDWFDIKDPIIIDVPVTLPPKALEQYKKMEKEMYLKIKGHEVEAFNAAARTIKCLQLANGFIYKEDKTWIPVHDAKLDALESIIEESAGAPILCVYHFKTDLIRLKNRFKYGAELDKNPATLRKWNRGEIPLLFAHPASAGHGLNLQDGGSIVVMFGHWWDLEQYLQIIERIGPTRQMQSGYDRPVYIYNIRAEHTIDKLVIQRRTDKRSVQDLLMDSGRQKV